MPYSYDRRASSALPKDHSKAFTRGMRDREAAERLFLAYVGAGLPAEMTASAKKLANALTKALPECQCSASDAKVGVLSSSHGGINVDIMCKSPVRSARVMRLALRSNVDVHPAERHYMTPSVVFMPPSLTLGLFDPNSNVYAAIEKKSPGLPQAKDALGLLKEFGVEKMLKALGGPFQGKGGPSKPTIQTVKEFVHGLRTYFDIDEESATTLSLSTRENGDVGEDRPGQHDIQEARRIVDQVRSQFGSANVYANWEAVDEWVHLTIKV